MEFGARPVYDGQSAPVPDTLRLAWFERSSAEGSSVAERGLVAVGDVELVEHGELDGDLGEVVEGGGGLLDRVREGEGLVYNGEGDYEY